MNGRTAIALAMTGASGALYGLRLLESLLEAGETVDFMISAPGQVVVSTESDFAGYKIYRNEQLIATGVTDTFYYDYGLNFPEDGIYAKLYSQGLKD